MSENINVGQYLNGNKEVNTVDQTTRKGIRKIAIGIRLLKDTNEVYTFMKNIVDKDIENSEIGKVENNVKRTSVEELFCSTGSNSSDSKDRNSGRNR